MCGIVGILGREPVAGALVDALKRLEYRGYDSAGVATLEGGQLARRRAEGKLRNLEAQLAREPLAGTIGIGHTRWATHGRPTESNAHPHATDRVAVVHNGIIENFRELREELGSKGAKFGTETDTEVVAHLVTEEMKNGRSPVEAVGGGAAAAARRLRARLPVRRRGRSADRRPQGLAARDRLRRRRDVSRLRRDRARAVHRHDHLSRGRRLGGAHAQGRRGPRRRRQQGRARGAQVATPRRFLVDKGNHRHFMAKEIHEQPEVVGHTLAHYLDMAAERVAAAGRRCRSISRKLERVSISACGTAYYAGLVAKYWFERFARLPVEIDVASEFRYREAPLQPGGLAIFVSQSGETADTLATLRYAKEQKQHVLAVVNVPTSTIARESDVVMPTLAGPEIGVASTKAFTCQLAVLACLAIAAGRARGVLSAERRAASWCAR